MKKKSKHFLYSEEGRLYLLEEYVKNDKSAYELAEMLHTYSNFIYRALRHHNIARKTHADAQKKSLEKGRSKHPTKGTTRDIETKNKIGETVHNYWENMSKKDMAKRIDKSRELWYTHSKEKHTEWRKKSYEKLREAAKDGSKAEKAILSAIIASGYKAQVHNKMVLEGSEMYVDIFLPVELTVIEINGPSHYVPLFGEEILEQTIKRDLKKRELLLANGYKFVEISNESGYYSKTVLDKFCRKFLPVLQEFVKSNESTLTVSVEEILDS
jgi:very-short-patch-repair endonuclease